MAKYSTGGTSGGGDGDSCELCGRTSDSLRSANVAGAQLSVCAECAPHDDNARTNRRQSQNADTSDQGESDRKQKAVQNAAKANDVWTGDSSRWEKEGTNYDDDQLPYLVSEYGQVLRSARQEAGLQREELAEELGADEADILALEQGRATQAGVGGSLVAALERRLDVQLSE